MGRYDSEIAALISQIEIYQREKGELEEKKERLEEAKRKLEISYEDVQSCKENTETQIGMSLPWSGNNQQKYWEDIWDSIEGSYDAYMSKVTEAEYKIKEKIQTTENKIKEVSEKIRNAKSSLSLLQTKNFIVFW